MGCFCPDFDLDKALVRSALHVKKMHFLSIFLQYANYMYRAASLRLPGVVKASANAHSHTQYCAYAILVYSLFMGMMHHAASFVNKICSD